MSHPRLPMWKVLFVDWHGVLSTEPYWRSILHGPARGLRSGLERRLEEVFEGGQGLSDDWMRGHSTTATLFHPVSLALTRRERRDFLERRIVEDCLGMNLERSLVAFLRSNIGAFRIVLATDNTNDFACAFELARAARSRDENGSTLRDTAWLFDDILCSSRRGVLKHEDPGEFFAPWLEENGLGFQDAILIDDRRDNCAAFRRWGGNAIVWGQSPSDREFSLTGLEAWSRQARLTARAEEPSPAAGRPQRAPRLSLRC